MKIILITLKIKKDVYNKLMNHLDGLEYGKFYISSDWRNGIARLVYADPEWVPSKPIDLSADVDPIELRSAFIRAPGAPDTPSTVWR